MEEGYVKVSDSVPTRVITVGGWIDKPIERKQLVVVIPGNPGLIGYYEKFILSLHEELQGQFVVWGLGHAGHDNPPNAKLPSVNDKPELFTLEGQVNHKIEFIEKYVPLGVKLHLIGHSIGSKISLELVKRFKTTHNATAYLLFPTLERMAETPSGRRLWPILGPLRNIVVMGASVINRLPESWLSTIIKWFISSKGSHLAIETSTPGSGQPMPHVNVRTTMKLLHPLALERSLFMAHDELRVVRELDVDNLRLHSDRLVLYFGTRDHWCPLEYCHNVQRHVPQVKTIICPHGFEHAFVLQSSQQMAAIVSEWIREFSLRNI